MSGARPPYADRLRTALGDALEHAQGKRSLPETVVLAPRVVRYEAADVVQIRSRLGVSQKAFAILLGVTVKAVQSWEQGVRKPSTPTMRLLQMLDRPDDFLQLVEMFQSSSVPQAPLLVREKKV
jgi:putative transcriptional regulator